MVQSPVSHLGLRLIMATSTFFLLSLLANGHLISFDFHIKHGVVKTFYILLIQKHLCICRDVIISYLNSKWAKYQKR